MNNTFKYNKQMRILVSIFVVHIKLLSFITILWFSIIGFSLYAQNAPIDSLYANLNTLKNDTLIVDIYNNLSYEYYAINIDSTFYYAEMAIELSKELQYPKGICKGLNNLGIGYSIKGDNRKAIEFYKQAFEIANKYNYINDITNIYNDIGISYKILGMTEKALESFLMGIESAKLADNADKIKCFLYDSIRRLYFSLGDDENRKLYRQYTIEASEQSNNHMAAYLADMLKGEKYFEEGKLDEAQMAYQRSKTLCTDFSCEYDISRKIIKVLLVQTKYKEAESIALHLINESKKINNIEILILSKYAYADILFKQERYDECLIQIDKSLADYNLTNEITEQTLKFYQLKSKALTQLRNYKFAVKSLKKEMVIQDSLLGKEKLETIAQLTAQYQLKEKEQENKFLKNQNDKNEIIIGQKNKESWLRLILSISLGAICIALGMLFYRTRNYNIKLNAINEKIEQKNKLLAQANETIQQKNVKLYKLVDDLDVANIKKEEVIKYLENFAYMVAHDLKSPLQVASGFSNILLKKNEKQLDDKGKEYLKFISSNISKMALMIDDVLALAKLDQNLPDTTEIDLAEIIENINYILKHKHLDNQFKIEVLNKLPLIKGHQSLVHKLFLNLINNSIVHNQTGEPVTVQIEVQNNDDDQQFATIVLEDNSGGIPNNLLDRVFDLFESTNKKMGNGIGLTICKKIVDYYGGNIWIKTEEGIGTSFNFQLIQQKVEKPAYLNIESS